LDEAVTASAAYGNYMVTGKPQVVMVHSELGTLQLGGNLQNLQWGRVPAVILAAYQLIDVQRTLWNGQPYDQGSIVRNSVKYDRRLEMDDDLHEALADAFRIACTEPAGPVYLSFPMEYLYQEIEKPALPVEPKHIAALPPVDMDMLEEMADILLDAKYPMIVSGNAGRHPENVEALVNLAETLSAPVLTGYSWMNFPSNHPLCIGIEQIGGSRKLDAGYDEADVILAVDYAMPYVGSAPPVNPETKILHIDVDPLTQGRLLWGRGADLFMKADAREAIPALTKILNEKTAANADKKAELAERFSRIAAKNEAIRRGWYESARGQADSEPLSIDYVCYCVNQLIDEDTIVVNHTLGHCASVTEQIVRTKPGTWFGCPSGAIGWAPGAALGAASVSPGKTVVAFMSDGGYVWGCPTSTFWTSHNYQFPFLAIVCDNKGYGAIRDVQTERLGETHPSERFIAESAVDFRLDYALTAEAAGAFGRIVTKSEEVVPALREALAAVKSGKPAVLDVRLPREK
ncbi:MAG: thiamine pyrophosphate-binding protein, partial [Clostridiales bacterium]|nr:thiamine pyrophosphate-binding protein [Clostridiales bacterium]